MMIDSDAVISKLRSVRDSHQKAAERAPEDMYYQGLYHGLIEAIDIVETLALQKDISLGRKT